MEEISIDGLGLLLCAEVSTPGDSLDAQIVSEARVRREEFKAQCFIFFRPEQQAWFFYDGVRRDLPGLQSLTNGLSVIGQHWSHGLRVCNAPAKRRHFL